MRLSDPDTVRVTNDVLAQQTHHSLMEGMVNAHVRSGVNACDPFNISSQESVTTPWERLESDPLPTLVNAWVKKGAFIIFCQLCQFAVIFIIVLTKKECF